MLNGLVHPLHIHGMGAGKARIALSELPSTHTVQENDHR